MLLFFRMLPESVTSADLRRFVQRAARPGWLARFLGPPNILKCQILRLPALTGSDVEHHGLVRVEPQSTALAVIRKLNGTHWKGTTLSVRKYQDRRAERDRRGQQPLVQQLAIHNRRTGDRRRPSMPPPSVDSAGEIRTDILLAPVPMQNRRDRE